MNTISESKKHFTGIFILSLLCVLLLLSCNNQSDRSYGSIAHKILFTDNATRSSLKSTKSIPSNTYTQFGSYITSLTPTVFIAKIRIMNYMDSSDLNSNSTHIISYIRGSDTSTEVTPVYAEFSNNQEVNITPILYSKDLHGDRVFSQKQVTFKYFNFVPEYLYQEVIMPTEYSGININQFQSAPNETDHKLAFYESSVLPKLFSCGYPMSYVFGNTDSTFIFNKNCQLISMSENNPFGGTQSGPVVRSHNYSPITVTMPEGAETITMYSTVSFDTQDLIQVYAGADNIPYTSDDIFVYAPKYWERIKVKLEIK